MTATAVPTDESRTERFDAVIVGAGFAGMYMLHCLRRLGLSARVFEAGSDVGGTWYWNRYPGARCDIESLQYSYSFSEELDQEWEWTEKYAPQPEILAYARHVADRFDLRRDICFDTRVTALTFDEAAKRWHVGTDRGGSCSAQFCIMAVGCLSAANHPHFQGFEDYRGEVLHTGEWPHEPVDFAGKRIAVIGTGSSAIQSIPVMAPEAAALTVFQRTPNYAVPAWNAPLDPDLVREVKADYPGFRAKARSRPTGFYFPYNTRPALASTPEERRRQYEECWERGGLPFLGAFGDLLFDKEANDTAADFAREKIRERVDDAGTAELLCPDNVFGCKRLCVDTGYYETYNQDHVTLVDISMQPIERFTAGGVVAHGVEYPADTVVFATGFAAMTGSFDRIRITGRDGLTLAEKWRAGPQNYLGLAVAGFPNFFHRHRARQPVRAREHAPLHRAACGLDRGLRGAYARHRRTDHRGAGRRGGGMGRACRRRRVDLAALHLFELVCRRQYSGPPARLHALYRRLPRLCAEMQRGAGGRFRGLRAGRARLRAAEGALHGALAGGARPGRALARRHRRRPHSHRIARP